ncbi:class I SAM-dependent methyltransferase [Planktomarina temperata]|nr:class I SAM-dependent methyltransferase [Planktomarina temperata]
MKKMKLNIDDNTVAGFGDEWSRFDQSDLSTKEHDEIFQKYFEIFPFESLSKKSVGFDMGCGSGRWAKLVCPRVGKLHCIDPSSALEVAKKNLSMFKTCEFHSAAVGDEILPPKSMDFGYSLGVLHHVPDTPRAICDCVNMLKPGAPFLIYLYYALDNKPLLYKSLWKLSNLFRLLISRFPHGMRFWASQIIALLIYFPLARLSSTLEKFGCSKVIIDKIPLHFYRNLSFYTMRTDALDRFGTRLEKRFSKEEIFDMLTDAGLVNIKFSDREPFWCAIGTRKGD